jgi:hypothetical protein
MSVIQTRQELDVDRLWSEANMQQKWKLNSSKWAVAVAKVVEHLPSQVKL